MTGALLFILITPSWTKRPVLASPDVAGDGTGEITFGIPEFAGAGTAAESRAGGGPPAFAAVGAGLMGGDG